MSDGMTWFVLLGAVICSTRVLHCYVRYIGHCIFLSNEGEGHVVSADGQLDAYAAAALWVAYFYWLGGGGGP